MGEPAMKPATYADVLRAPEHHIAEIIGGELHVAPRPAAPHASAHSRILFDVGAPFSRNSRDDGSGGWWILVDPELHLGAALGSSDPRSTVLVPDIAGWRRERMPEIPDVAAFTLVPDWVCEVISPRSAAHDRVRKLQVYAQAGVPHYWLVDPQLRTLEVLRLVDGHYQIALVTEGDDPVRAAPFDAVALDPSEWWLKRPAPDPA